MDLEQTKTMLFAKQTLISLLLLFLFGSCTTTIHKSRLGDQPKGFETENVIVIKSDVVFNEMTQFDKPVTIYPNAIIRTQGNGKIVFKRPVHILVDIQVFDQGANIEFAAGTISSLNVIWFGAKGDDYIDDTEAIEAAVNTARISEGSLSIYYPAGRYIISRSVDVSSREGNKKSIHLLGATMSNSSINGSSIIYNGIIDSTMFIFSNLNQFRIENLDFTAEPSNRIKYNLQFEPFIHQVVIRNCSFSGVHGEGSANINLNAGNNLQVSEVHFENCTFNSFSKMDKYLSASAVIGGLANTKNFYFNYCSFSGYQTAAISISISDIVEVNGCTFSWNNVDIGCDLCGLMASNNYSEHSLAFFQGSVTANPAFTTLINNRFSGAPKEGCVIRNGSGHLILMNNHFGFSGYGSDENKVCWAEGVQNSIYSLGNFYKNTSSESPPFKSTSSSSGRLEVESTQDTGGPDFTKRISITW